MTIPKVPWFPLLLIPALLAACRSYEPAPLDPTEILATIEASMRGPASGEPCSFGQAAAWLDEHGPDVLTARAAFRTARARANVGTPWPNPEIEFGPQWKFGSGLGSGTRMAPFGSIGIAIPWGGRVAAEDDLNLAEAEVASVVAAATHRESLLELRSRYTEWVLARRVVEARRAIAAAAEQSSAVARALVDAGRGTALEVSLFALESARSRSRLSDAERDVVGVTNDLAELTGVSGRRFTVPPPNALPRLPSSPPAPDELRSALIDVHPGLGRIRARYEAAERALRLEVARSLPDLVIGTELEAEPGEHSRTLGLPLGLELPVFDGNGQAIASAEAHRAEVRVEYEAEFRRALARLEGARRLLEIASRSRRDLESTLLPRAEETRKLARDTASAGAADALQLLEAERSYREIRIEVLDAERAERMAWSELESAVGRPLLRFPGEEREEASR